jgi:hypothetical protein
MGSIHKRPTGIVDFCTETQKISIGVPSLRIRWDEAHVSSKSRGLLAVDFAALLNLGGSSIRHGGLLILYARML